MKIPPFLFVIGRLCFLIYVLLTSCFCLLTYVPFTYHQINVGGLLPWVTTFVKYHSFLYWPTLALVALTLDEDRRAPKTKVLTLGFLCFYTIVGVVLLFHPLLRGVKNDTQSLVWSLIALAPLLWVAAIDWLGHGPKITWARSSRSEDQRVFRAAWQSALYLTMLYAAIFSVRNLHAAATGIGAGERLLALIWSAVYHLVMFMAVFATLHLVRTVASFFSKPSRVEFLISNILALLLLAVIFSSLVFPPISFGGSLAMIFAFTLALCLVGTNAGLSARLYRPEEGAIESGLKLLLRPVTFGRTAYRLARAAPLLAIAVAAFLLAVETAVMDWNFLLQKLSALLVWTAVFACFYALAPRLQAATRGTIVLLLVAAASLGALEGLKAAQPRLAHWLPEGEGHAEGLLDRYAGYDVSFKLIHDMLSPLRSANLFYKFLSQNTNIPQSTRVGPVEVRLVENLTESKGVKPHIFIFVIDSLRRDYLSSYNPAVTFTPSMDSFGRESVVMENAFTRYGGTGLSEPSLWVGGMILHKQYITPFYPMNALQKLIEADHYQSYVSKDPVLSVVMAPSHSLTELDKDIGGMNYDFCKSLGELEEKIGGRKDTTNPIFAYTQPQNIHISVVNREGRTVPAGESYPGFDAPYASRLKKLDACFGEFVRFLKAKGLYDNSIVILTSDHGDSLGEGGRWGHAYTLFPEIVRIPLLIHLPARLAESLSINPQGLAFLTDITPTLYYLLGHKPVLRNEIFGRPLFTDSPQEQADYLRDWYMVASSYGPVYGILKNSGHSLFVVDAVNYQDYFFTLGENLMGKSEPVTSSMRADNERWIRDDILAVDRFYKFGERR